MQLPFDELLNQLKEQTFEQGFKEEVLNKLRILQKETVRLDFKYQRVLQDKQALDAFLKESLEELEKQKREVQEAYEEMHLKNAMLTAMEEELRQNAEHLKNMNENLELMIAERTQEILQQKAIIEDKNEKILQSIDYAQNIQQTIFPHIEEIKQVLADCFTFFRPRDIVSGDFYWFYATQHGGVITAIDCTGHGVPGAFMSLISKEFLFQIIVEQGITTPATILQHLHNKIRRSLKQSLGKNSDGADAVLVTVDYKTNQWHFAGAKNSLLLIQNNRPHFIRGDKWAIGGEQREAERFFTNHTFDLTQEVIMYLYTDGFQDQFGGAQDKKYTSLSFRNLLYYIHHQPFEQQQQILATTFDAWKGEKEQIDDVLVLGIKIKPK